MQISSAQIMLGPSRSDVRREWKTTWTRHRHRSGALSCGCGVGRLSAESGEQGPGRAGASAHQHCTELPTAHLKPPMSACGQPLSSQLRYLGKGSKACRRGFSSVQLRAKVRQRELASRCIIHNGPACYPAANRESGRHCEALQPVAWRRARLERR